MGLYRRLASLPVEITDYRIEQREQETSSDFTRVTTIITLHGDGVSGRGEDVTYDSEPHETLAKLPAPWDLTGSFTLDSFSRHLDDVDLFPRGGESSDMFQHYRRWALESAALDLALKQQTKSLGDALDEEYRPVRFIVSTRLGDPPTLDRLDRIRSIHADLEFKLDPTSAWTDDLVADLAERGSVVSLDLKGQYEGTLVDQEADPALYERVIKGFPNALIEDPAITDETRPLFDGNEERITWDYPITGIESVEALPWQPQWLNIKPSRFGSLESLFETIDYCQQRDIRLYGGGQFELGVGRTHLHTLASLFYPDAPNDIAPRAYNGATLPRNCRRAHCNHPNLPQDLIGSRANSRGQSRRGVRGPFDRSSMR